MDAAGATQRAPPAIDVPLRAWMNEIRQRLSANLDSHCARTQLDTCECAYSVLLRMAESISILCHRMISPSSKLVGWAVITEGGSLSRDLIYLPGPHG